MQIDSDLCWLIPKKGKTGFSFVGAYLRSFSGHFFIIIVVIVFILIIRCPSSCASGPPCYLPGQVQDGERDQAAAQGWHQRHLRNLLCLWRNERLQHSGGYQRLLRTMNLKCVCFCVWNKVFTETFRFVPGEVFRRSSVLIVCCALPITCCRSHLSVQFSGCPSTCYNYCWYLQV